VTAVAIALTFALSTICFPDRVFSLLTNHPEVSQAMQQYTVWLIPLLGLTAAVFMLESYFIGTKNGATLRNGALLGFGIGFAPLVLLARYLQSDGLLWASLTAYMGVMLLFLTYRFIQVQEQLANSNSRAQLPESSD
jgi:multidrug resistance protein, MATE family